VHHIRDTHEEVTDGLTIVGHNVAIGQWSSQLAIQTPVMAVQAQGLLRLVPVLA